MRELIIKRHKEIIDVMNMPYKGKKYKYPNFDKMKDDVLLVSFESAILMLSVGNGG